MLLAVGEEARPRLFHRLLDLEVRYRRQAGRPLTTEETCRRFTALGSWVGEILMLFEVDPDESALLLEVLEGPVSSTPGATHFCIEYNPPQARLIDCKSKNGTFQNGARLEPPGVRFLGGEPTITRIPPVEAHIEAPRNRPGRGEDQASQESPTTHSQPLYRAAASPKRSTGSQPVAER
jgi:hypothetical protein